MLTRDVFVVVVDHFGWASIFFVYCFGWVGRETFMASEIILLKYLPISFLIKPYLHFSNNEVTALFLKAHSPILLQSLTQAF